MKNQKLVALSALIKNTENAMLNSICITDVFKAWDRFLVEYDEISDNYGTIGYDLKAYARNRVIRVYNNEIMERYPNNYEGLVMLKWDYSWQARYNMWYNNELYTVRRTAEYLCY